MYGKKEANGVEYHVVMYVYVCLSVYTHHHEHGMQLQQEFSLPHAYFCLRKQRKSARGLSKLFLLDFLLYFWILLQKVDTEPRPK